MASTTRRLVTLLFDVMERDDVKLSQYLISQGFTNTFVGISGGRDDEYQFTARVVGEDTRQKADLKLEDAAQLSEIDVLLVPGGPGAFLVKQNENIGKLVDMAKLVVGFSQGSIIIANTGRLNGKEATTHHMWATPEILNRWPEVKWKPKSSIIQDGKFITAYTIPNSQNVSKVSTLLIASLNNLPAPDLSASTSSSATPSLSQLSLSTELMPWQLLLRQIHARSKQLVDQERAEGVDVSADVLEADPYLRDPASAQDIEQAELTLGVELPGDYKKFLKASNGTGFSGIGDIPSLSRVAGLQWGEADEMGFESLKLDKFPPGAIAISQGGGTTESIELTAEEFESAPPFRRVLQISDPDEDEIVCLLEPTFVRDAWVDLMRKRGVDVEAVLSAEGSVTPKWLLFRFIPWAASFKIFGSFEEYMRSKL